MGNKSVKHMILQIRKIRQSIVLKKDVKKFGRYVT